MDEVQKESFQASNAVDERIISKLNGQSAEEIEEALDFYRRRFRTSKFTRPNFDILN